MATYTVELTEGTTEKAFLAFMKALEIPFKKSKAQKEEKPYNPEFSKMLQESVSQMERGEVHKIDLKTFWK